MAKATLSDGRVIKFPDGLPPERVKMIIQKASGQQPVEADQPSIAGDVVKSLGIGLTKGAMAIPGSMGDAQQLVGSLGEGAASMFGASPQTQAMVKDFMTKNAIPIPGMMGNQLPTTEQIQGSVEGVTGEFYKPKTTAGEYAETVGEFAPAAVAGPGGLIRKGAMAVVPAVASETAGQVTEGTELEPYARLTGALAGGVAAAGRSTNALKQMRQSAPSLQEVGAKTNALYTKLRAAGIQYDSRDYRSMVMRLANKLHQHGWRPRDGDPISSDIKELVGRLNTPNVFAELENLRQYVGNIPKTASNTDLARAAMIRDEITDFINNGKVLSTKGLPQSQIKALTDEARDYARRNILGKKIETMKDKSEWYLGGEESGLRNRAASMGKSEGNRMSPAEQSALKKIVRREGLMNFMNVTGSRMGQAILGGSMVFGGAGIPAAAATMAAHFAARKGSEAYTKKAIRDALATVLAGKGAQVKATSSTKSLKGDIMARRLLSGGSALQQSNR